jgi:hypothetical protein
MKEIDFSYINGLGGTNTPVQLDNFEKPIHRALKDRYIFDFSQNIGSLVPGEIVGGPDETRRIYGWQNLSPSNSIVDNFGNSAAGQAQLIYKNLVPVDNSYENRPNPSRVPTVLAEEYQSPYWENNAIIYLDQRGQSLYGAGSLSNFLRYFRSGYLELSIKTNKQNCVIAYGSANATSQTSAEFTGFNTSVGNTVYIDNNIAVVDELYSDLNELKISIKNGKLNLEYNDNYGANANSFSILGNKNIADDEWHHVVINFGKPGTLRTHSKKFNKRFIEFWVDGIIDIRNYDYTQKQIFFPMVEWLLGDPTLTFNKNFYGEESEFLSYDIQYPLGDPLQTFDFLGNTELNLIKNAVFNPIGDSVLFSGSIHHYVFGVNTSLSKFEIQQRNRLYRDYENNKVSVLSASATMSAPSVSTNKKKALKLFWNNLINDKAKNGIQLDNNFDVKNYSVTHKTLNSSTEINNIDLSNKKSFVSLPDVKIVLTDNIMLWGPGKDLVENSDELAESAIGNGVQWNGSSPRQLDSLRLPNMRINVRDVTQQYVSEIITPAFIDLPFSGLDLKSGDRILLTNQFNPKHNGIYVFNGYSEIVTRASDSSSPKQINDGVVRVTDGYYKDTSWKLKSNISSFSQGQEWIQLQYQPNEDNLNSQPIFGSRWLNNNNEERFIDLEQDINFNDYDLIVFMNYPESNEEIKESFIGYDNSEIKNKYESFIKSLQNVVAQGANLYVSSPKLAEDLGIVKKFTYVDQLTQASDLQSASINPFESGEDPERYFDTHRNNKYSLANEVSGLTNKETYILTDFINYNPDNNYDYEQYHAKYSYRQFGLLEGNEFLIPGLALRSLTLNDNLPGFTQNQKRTNALAVVEPSDIITGTVVTQLANTYYAGSTVTNNPYDDYASTIIVHNNQILNGQPVTGKIFVNCVEDAYSFSRQEYNKAVIQVVPEGELGESIGTRAWQYSTSRLNREPQRINVSQLTEFGQTTPTNGGGGPLIQAPTSSSNGIIRSENDLGNKDYQSDLYPKETEERYTIQEIPTLSMTWLGLEWLIA